MYDLKSKAQIKLMRKAGLLVYEAHEIIASLVRPGITTREIDAEVEKFFMAHHAEGLFKGVKLYARQKAYPSVTCMSINEEVVHGIPSDRVLIEGDILSVDTGCRINGWCGDSARTYAVGHISEEDQKLMDATLGTLNLAIELLGEKQYWNQVATLMEKYVHDRGFAVVDAFIGHGIGREMHEGPQVANYYCRSGDFKLSQGLVIAVEPMVNAGTHKVVEMKDGWVQVTADRKKSAHFEHTIALTEYGPYILTAGPDQYNNAQLDKLF